MKPKQSKREKKVQDRQRLKRLQLQAKQANLVTTQKYNRTWG